MFTRNELKALKENGTKLERKVINMLLDRGDAEEIQSYMEDILQHGCISGIVSELIYYNDTVEFFKKYKRDINNLLTEMLEETGATSPVELFKTWEESDPLAEDTSNQNLLAWFSFEETVRNIANQLELDI